MRCDRNASITARPCRIDNTVSMPTHNTHRCAYTCSNTFIDRGTPEDDCGEADLCRWPQSVITHTTGVGVCAFVVCMHITLVVHCYVHAPHRIGSSKREPSKWEPSSGGDDHPGHIQPQSGHYLFAYVLLLCTHGVVVQVHHISTSVFIHAHM